MLTYGGDNGNDVDNKGHSDLPGVKWQPSIDSITLQHATAVYVVIPDSNTQGK